ncbi:MAG: hydroxymethylbilane synthase [Persephonella sp.]|nr:MAG: hydroxymethylbilane synthase [Persephonella sp.]
MLKVRIGTRKSKLALWQTEFIAKKIKEFFPEVEIEIVKITTKGDKILDVPLAKIGGKGLFVKEIEEALLNNEIDLAVHSLKDVPTYFPDGLGLGAITEREDPRDCLASIKYNTLEELPNGATVGTSSLRRKSQLLKLRPDLKIKDLRGNVDTRLKKLQNGEYDAIVLAYAGLKRLGLDDKATYIFSPYQFIPAVAQGFLGIEIRLDDKKTAEIVNKLNHYESYLRAEAERAFLKRLEGGCQVPLGCYSEISGDSITLTGFISDLSGKRFLKETLKGKKWEYKDLGVKLAERLLKKGGEEILREIY